MKATYYDKHLNICNVRMMVYTTRFTFSYIYICTTFLNRKYRLIWYET